MPLASLVQILTHLLAWFEHLYRCGTQLPQSSVTFGPGLDLTRSRSELLLENALLRQQLVILQRQVKKPQLTRLDRLSLLFLASRLNSWKQALVILKPDTLLRWHRQGFRLLWRLKSRARPGRPRLGPELVALIQQMAAENPLWGAERIRGELLKLGIRVAKDTIHTYLRCVRPPRLPSQDWNTFLKNHAHDVWACDFLRVINLFFRTVYVFFIIELGSRRVVHFGVTRHPVDAWVAQQLREATPYGVAPQFLIRDNDRKFGSAFSSVAKASGIEVLRTPYRAPRANAICERFIGRVRRECLDHLLIVSDDQLYRVIKEYVEFFNGIVTNDKFCMSRTARLRLSRYRHAPYPRQWVSHELAYPSDEPAHRGGPHETSLDHPSPLGRNPRRRAALGSSLPMPSALGTGNRAPTESGTPFHGPLPTGGKP